MKELKTQHRKSSAARSHPNRLLRILTVSTFIGSNSAMHHMQRPPVAWVVQRDSSVPLVVTNKCQEVIYPGVLTQSGSPPSSGGFKLNSGETKNFTVGQDWQGRVWGRTNCTFNSAGTGPGNTGGNNGGGRACGTGDCGGIINCKGTVCDLSGLSLEDFPP